MNYILRRDSLLIAEDRFIQSLVNDTLSLMDFVIYRNDFLYICLIPPTTIVCLSDGISCPYMALLPISNVEYIPLFHTTNTMVISTFYTSRLVEHVTFRYRTNYLNYDEICGIY